jgi:ubiquinone/menaquinone biosynthesis C-methylase UbiE
LLLAKRAHCAAKCLCRNAILDQQPIERKGHGMAAGDSFSSWNKYADVDRERERQDLIRHMDWVSDLQAVSAYKRETYELLEATAGSHLLDVGCGPGDDVRAMAELTGPSGRVVGVDKSAAMIETAQARSAGSDLPVAFQVEDCYRLSFAGGAFDGCRADRVLHHLEDGARAVAEMARVTRPGGYITFGASLEKAMRTARISLVIAKPQERSYSHDHGRFYHGPVLSGG